MEVFIIVCTHKKFKIPTKDMMYHVVLGGAMLDSKNLKEYIRDDSIEDNISHLNPYYCELTALYWGWKKAITSEYIGLVHYRRYFMNYRSSRIPCEKVGILCEDDCKNILTKYKIILPYWSGRPINAVKDLRQQRDIPYFITEKIIANYYPEMLASYKKIAYGYKMAYGNMFITKREFYNEYCNWLFDVLKKLDEELKKRNIQKQPRMNGFLSETLLNVWCNYKFKEKEIYRLPVIKIDEDLNDKQLASCKYRKQWIDYRIHNLGRIIKLIGQYIMYLGKKFIENCRLYLSDKSN